jgi:asparagine synthase (glutamine-hydrolysing)
MANFFACIDPNPQRRAALGTTPLAELMPLPALRSGAEAAGDLVLLWAAGRRAPVTVHRGEDEVRFIAGRPRQSSYPHASAAPRSAEIKGRGGYFVDLHWTADGGLVVATDLLGFFPVYYWSDGSILVVSSSPELFRLHPCFEPRISERALVSVLLLMHPVGGDSLWKGVRRLGPGATLRWRPHAGVT